MLRNAVLPHQLLPKLLSFLLQVMFFLEALQRAIHEAGPSGPCLEKLVLSRNPGLFQGDGAASALATALQGLKGLTFLDLRCCRINADAMKALAPGLVSLTALR